MTKLERSFLPMTVTEIRVENEGDKQYITGYASVFNEPTDKVGFREVVKPGAFTRALKEKQDVRILFNHDPSSVLGRTKSGTATLSEDKKGLKFRCEMPNTTVGRDVMESMQRGDIDQCSFGFRAVKQAWVNQPDPEDKTRTIATRELHDVDLSDASVVTYPAYDGTSCSVSRSVSAAELRTYFPEGVPDDVEENMNYKAESRAVKYLVTEKDGTKHLPYTKEDGKPDHNLMGAAWAALHGGYRGNKYEGPNKDEAIAKLKAIYKSEGMDTPEKNSDERDRMEMRLKLQKANEGIL